MGKGRAPCCDKSKVKRGPWSPAEDLKLVTFIQKHGHDNWRSLPKQSGLLRCGKSCRLRWINYLRPDVKRGNFSKEEEDTVIKLHETLGNKWSKIASYLPGRTDNEIKNVWNTHFKKKLGLKVQKSKELSSISSSTSSSSTTTLMSHSKRSSDTGVDEEDHVSNTPRDTILENVVMQDSQTNEESNQIIINNNNKEELINKKELSTSSSGTSSNNSSQVDNATRPDFDQGSFFEFSNGLLPYDDHIVPNTLEEVNKPDDINTFDIPLESDQEFWDMLNGLETVIQSNEVVEGITQSSSLGDHASNDSTNIEVDHRKKWFRYFENELGLEEATGVDQNLQEAAAAVEPEPLNPEVYELLLKPEVDPGMSYFQLWPSSPPHN